VIKLSNILSEVAYDGNMGFHEMYLFYGKASDSQVDKLEKLILDKKFREAWKLVQNVVGVKLKGKEFESVSENIEEDLKKWFGKGKWGGKGGGGWDRYSTTGEVMGKCGDAKEGEPYSACLSKEAATKLGKKGIASFVRRKRDAQTKGGDAKKGGEKSDGDKPIRVSWNPKGKKKFNPPK